MKKIFNFQLSIFNCLIALLISANAFAAETTLSGVSPSYAGKKLTLQKYTDRIADDTQILSETEVDTSGYFSFDVDIQKPVEVFIPTDHSNNFIYLEPGKTYTVTLPRYEEKSFFDKLDPHFEKDDYLLQIEGLKKGDFNYQMMEFEDAYDFFTIKQMAADSNPDSIRTYIQEMRNNFTDFTDDFQKHFLEYRFILFESFSPKIPQDTLIASLNRLGADVDNPAFWQAFEEIFNDFIEKTGVGNDNQQFAKIIASADAKSLFSFLKSRYGISEQHLLELTAIQLIYDLTGTPNANVIQLLRNMQDEITIDANKKLTSSIIDKATLGLPGTPAPDFIGKDTEGNEHKISDYKGKYVYLYFGNSQINQTMKDLAVLSQLKNKYHDDLIVLNVFLYDSPELVKRISSFYTDMIFLSVESPEFIRDLYRIVNIPSSFLLDKNGNFLSSAETDPNDKLRTILQENIYSSSDKK